VQHLHLHVGCQRHAVALHLQPHRQPGLVLEFRQRGAQRRLDVLGRGEFGECRFGLGKRFLGDDEILLGARARADLSGAAALLPDPPALSRALGLSAVGAAAEAARGEVRALRDALNGEYRSYPDTRNRQNASLATNESFDGAQGAANTLAGYPGAAGQPLKGLVQSGEESVRTLVGLCDAYHSMYALAGDVK